MPPGLFLSVKRHVELVEGLHENPFGTAFAQSQRQCDIPNEHSLARAEPKHIALKRGQRFSCAA